MPTYDYECAACGHKFELFQGIKENPIKSCPRCKKRKARRLIGTGAGLLFKGSGFYITDYRSEGYKKAQKAETSSSSSSGEASGSKKGETTKKAETAKKGD